MMKQFNISISIILFLSIVPFCIAELTCAQVLEILSSRDAQFNNVNLCYLRSTEHKIPHEFISDMSPDKAKEIMAYGTIKSRTHCQMTMRDREITFTNKADTSVQGNHPSISSIPLVKATNRGGYRRQLQVHDSDYRQLDIQSTRGIFFLIAMETEFSFGLGFGKRLKTVDSVTQTDNGHYKITGTIQPFKWPVSQLEMIIDENYIVREAKICNANDNGMLIIEVKTKGTIENKRFIFSEFGEYKQYYYKVKDGKPIGKEYIVEQFQVQFEDVQWDLSDEDYEDLTLIEMTPGTRVHDYVLNTRYTVGALPGSKKNSPEP